MPKFGAHMIIADAAASRRPDLFDDLDQNALRLGAIGPDTTLFLFDPAGGKPLVREGFSRLMSILRTVRNLKDELKRIETELTSPLVDLQDWASGGLSRELRYTLNAGLEALFLAIKLGIALELGKVNINNPVFQQLQGLPADYVKDPTHAAPVWRIEAVDSVGFPFRMFGHPFTDDGDWKDPLPAGDYAEWWWMDMLHYRKTGSFASKLLSSARGSTQKSYARGYLTHVGGDICGHPFINVLVGGPFRNHAFRHMVLETIADVDLWSTVGGDVMDARFDNLIDINDDQAAEIADLVVKAMQDVYQPPMVPRLLNGGYPTRGEFIGAYRLMQEYLRLSTGGTIPRPNPPPNSPSEIIKEVQDLLKQNMPGPPPSWNGDIADFLRALISWFGKGAALLVMLATLPSATLLRFLTAAPRWVIYLINLGMFYIVSALRTMICLIGWGYCSSEDLDNFGFLRPLVRVGEGTGYPYQTVPVPKPPFYWLLSPERPASPIHPGASVELPRTWPLAPRSYGVGPRWMIDPNNRMDVPAVLAFFAAADPAETITLENQYVGRPAFGNAVDFSIKMLAGEIPIPDLDLDGDRGFGFKGWEGLPPGGSYV